MASNGLRFLAEQLLGFDELSWAQDERDERLNWLRLGMAHECGWVGEYVGPGLNFGWEVHDSGSGVLAIRTSSGGVSLLRDLTRADSTRPFIGVDRRGRVLEILAGELLDADGEPITVPNDGVWRTLIARYATRTHEPGTLELTGSSTTVTGTGTQFTRYSDSTDPQPTLLRIDADDTSEGNEGTYQIATITSDTALELVSAPPTDESDVKFRVKAQFFSGDPADPDAHNNAHVTWELVTRTTTRPTDTLVAYDVRRSGGTVTTIDRRRASLYRQITADTRCFALTPAQWIANFAIDPAPAGDADSVLLPYHRITYVNNDADASTGVIGLALAPASTGSHTTGLASDQPSGMLLAGLYDDGSANRTIQISHYTQVSDESINQVGAWDHPDGGSAVTIAAAGLLDVAVIALPADSGNTHALFYVDTNGSVIQRTSTDQGATWSGATTIWNPAGAEQVSRVAAVLTRMNRVVLVGAYSTGNRIRAIMSDDLCATWDNNSQAGYGYSGSTASTDVAICEDDRGNLWTVSAEGSDNGIRLYRGQAEGNPVPATAEQSSGWVAGPERDCPTVDCFAMPNGLVGIVCDAIVSSNRRIDFMVAARRQIVHHQALFASPGVSDDKDSPVGVGVSANGVVFLAHGNNDTTGSNDAKAIISQWLPVSIERSHAWYGGQ